MWRQLVGAVCNALVLCDSEVLARQIGVTGRAVARTVNTLEGLPPHWKCFCFKSGSKTCIIHS